MTFEVNEKECEYMFPREDVGQCLYVEMNGVESCRLLIQGAVIDKKENCGMYQAKKYHEKYLEGFAIKTEKANIGGKEE